MQRFINEDGERDLQTQLRDALDTLYDHTRLEQHPLNELLGLPGGVPGRGKLLQQKLSSAIEALRPAPNVPPHTSAWRLYRLLHLRYVEAQSSTQVAQELGVGERQLRRDHKDALLALCGILAPSAPPAPAENLLTPSAETDEEVTRIGMAAADEEIDVATVVQGVQATVARLAAMRGARFEVLLAAQASTAQVNSVALRQALISLLSWLFDHANSVELTSVPTANGLELWLNSTGDIPLSSEDARLRIGSRLIELQGGSLNVVSLPDGVRVVIGLRSRAPLAVLIVDDNPDIIRLFQRYIAAIGGQAVGITDSDKTLQLVQAQRPDLIILDVMMPQQDGWEVLQQLKNHPETATLPVLVCSVLKERDLALSLGADAFLPKPVSQSALLTALGPFRRNRIRGD
jgi:CheY-like chemotaxis protein